MPQEPDLPPPFTDEDPPPFDSHPPPRTTRLQSAPTASNPNDASRTHADDASLPPAYTPPRYRGHANEEEYLAALRAWADEKMYTKPADKSQLVGFYGAETMRERIAKAPPPPSLRLRGARKKGEVGEERGGGEREGRRRSSIGNWLSRKRTN